MNWINQRVSKKSSTTSKRLSLTKEAKHKNSDLIFFLDRGKKRDQHAQLSKYKAESEHDFKTESLLSHKIDTLTTISSEVSTEKATQNSLECAYNRNDAWETFLRSVENQSLHDKVVGIVSMVQRQMDRIKTIEERLTVLETYVYKKN